jgi:DNA polymerase-3 subunit alpha
MASFMFDINDFNDPNAWDLICEGRTKGVFQLESQLGRSWAKRVKPRNIAELAALISLIRPGCLKAYSDGKSMTQHYVDRKAKKDPVTYPDDSLEEILSETYGVLVYQEQSMRIAQKLAGFDLKDADQLRKAIGKKKADLMEKVKKSFLEGAEKQGFITKEVAEEIFGWIEKSNRYAFNKSHAVSYAINAYWSAYCKHYKPTDFYVSYLNHSDRKPDSQKELKELIVDAKSLDLETYPPRLQHLHTDFTDVGETIFFGLRHIKHVGQKECDKIAELTEDISEYTWLDVLINVIQKCKLNKRAVIALISVGAFNGKNNTNNRQAMLYEFDSWKKLTATETKYICANYQNYKTLADCIEGYINSNKVNKRRLPTVIDIMNALENPMYSLDDDVQTIATDEQKYMGCALTCSLVDGFHTNFSISLCKDISRQTIKGKTHLAVQLNSVRQYKTKKGKNPGQTMAFIVAEDSSGVLDGITIFPEQYEQFKDLLIENNTVVLSGEVSKKENTSIIVNKVTQI